MIPRTIERLAGAGRCVDEVGISGRMYPPEQLNVFPFVVVYTVSGPVGWRASRHDEEASKIWSLKDHDATH